MIRTNSKILAVLLLITATLLFSACSNSGQQTAEQQEAAIEERVAERIAQLKLEDERKAQAQADSLRLAQQKEEKTLSQEKGFAYDMVKAYLIGEGYTVCEDRYANLAKGESAYIDHTFSPGLNYQIAAFSEDKDVTNVEVYAYYSDGTTVYMKGDDANSGAGATLSFTPSVQMPLKILWENDATNAPRYKSTVRLLVACK